MNICQILMLYYYKCYGTNSIYLLSMLYAILYCPSQRKQHVYENLASWMMVQAPPTTASLFWFYYNNFINIKWQAQNNFNRMVVRIQCLTVSYLRFHRNYYSCFNYACFGFTRVESVVTVGGACESFLRMSFVQLSNVSRDFNFFLICCECEYL